MDTQGEQGFSDGGSWISTGGWLSKTISTVGYNTIEVGYLLTKTRTPCDLNVSIDGGNNWTNVLSDSGAGGSDEWHLAESAEVKGAWCYGGPLRSPGAG